MTFSIAARCPRTGQLGVAIATKFLAVGATALERRFRAGLCVTQAYVSPLYRMWTLDALQSGASPEEALALAREKDPRPDLRQVAVLTQDGRVAAFTGEKVDTAKAQHVGDGFVAMGNMLASDEVIASMVDIFLAGEALPLERRLLASLNAGYASGGDKRGMQSACLQLYGTQPYATIDLRVDDSPQAIDELGRLLDVYDRDFRVKLAGLASLEEPAGRLGH